MGYGSDGFLGFWVLELDWGVRTLSYRIIAQRKRGVYGGVGYTNWDILPLLILQY